MALLHDDVHSRPRRAVRRLAPPPRRRLGEGGSSPCGWVLARLRSCRQGEAVAPPLPPCARACLCAARLSRAAAAAAAARRGLGRVRRRF